MSGENFQQRVSVLRDSWAERRQLQRLASVHDFESQFGLLRTLHAWAEAATADIRAVYGDELQVSLSPAPGPGTATRSFSVTLGDSYTIACMLAERPRGGGSRWSVAVTVSSTGPGGSMMAAGPERRNGQWTRARLEDILLSSLGSWERVMSEGARGAAPGGMRARGA
jgi:hypothetical protein